MHLQVLRVSTGKSCTKMQWEKAIEKIKSDSSVGLGLGLDSK